MSRMPDERPVLSTKSTRPTTGETELPDYVKDVLQEQNPSRFFTMNKQQVADYLKTKGVITTRHKVTRAIYDGTLASKLDGKRRLVSEWDAIIWALSGREHFTRDRQAVSA